MFYDIDVDYNSQVTLSLANIRKIVPSISTYQSKTIYKFELVTKGIYCSVDSDRATYEKYLNIRFDKFLRTEEIDLNEEPVSEHTTNRKETNEIVEDDIDRKIDEMFA